MAGQKKPRNPCKPGNPRADHGAEVPAAVPPPSAPPAAAPPAAGTPPAGATDGAAGAGVLDALHRVILSRRGADPDQSHTARLFARGRAKIAQKVGEEAVETVIEGIRGDKAKLAEESADLLYHLLVLWADADLEPARVYAILDGRRGTSGIEEKKNRKPKGKAEEADA